MLGGLGINPGIVPASTCRLYPKHWVASEARGPADRVHCCRCQAGTVSVCGRGEVVPEDGGGCTTAANCATATAPPPSAWQWPHLEGASPRHHHRQQWPQRARQAALCRGWAHREAPGPSLVPPVRDPVGLMHDLGGSVCVGGGAGVTQVVRGVQGRRTPGVHLEESH